MSTFPRRRATIFSAWIFALVLVAYLPSLGNGWIWDDNHYVTDNIDLHTLHGLGQLWFRPGAVPQYYPVTHTTFWLEYHLFGLWPLPYHLDNVLLHGATAVLAGVVLRRLGCRGWWLAAAIFAIHPIHVESVGWVTERKNVLSGFFYAMAMLLALDVWRIAPAELSKSQLRSRYALCLLLFMLALLSKSVTGTFPAIVLLLIFWKRGRFAFFDCVALLPFFVCAAAMGTVTAWMERHVVGATGAEWDWSLAKHVLVATRAICFYAGKIIWPHPLIFMYRKWDVDARMAWQWAFALVLLVTAMLLWFMRRQWGKGPGVAMVFFVITLIPALGFAHVYPMRYSYVADHFQYLASLGPIALIAEGIMVLNDRRRNLVGIAFCLLMLHVMTWHEQHAYANSVSLWKDVIAKVPDSSVAYCNLGGEEMNAQDREGAQRDLAIAARLDGKAIEPLLGLGLLQVQQKHFDEGEIFYDQALALAPESPLPWFDRGLLKRAQGRSDEALADLAQSLRWFPVPAQAFEQMGEIEMSRQNWEKAREHFEQAIVSDPDLYAAENNLAMIAISVGGSDAVNVAERHCNNSLTINPDGVVALSNLGVICARRGEKEAALRWFSRAVEIDPDFEPARQNLRKLRGGF